VNIDIPSISRALGAASAALQLLKQAKDLVPEGSKKQQVDEAIQSAEEQLKIARSQAAQGLEFELCRNHFPPEVMISKDDMNWECPKCGNTKYTGPVTASISSLGTR
jgi:hypothetical protein